MANNCFAVQKRKQETTWILLSTRLLLPVPMVCFLSGCCRWQGVELDPAVTLLSGKRTPANSMQTLCLYTCFEFRPCLQHRKCLLLSKLVKIQKEWEISMVKSSSPGNRQRDLGRRNKVNTSGVSDYKVHEGDMKLRAKHLSAQFLHLLIKIGCLGR